MYLYLSAFNKLDTNTILRAIDQAPWRDKDKVQVFVKEQEEDTFTLRYLRLKSWMVSVIASLEKTRNSLKIGGWRGTSFHASL